MCEYKTILMTNKCEKLAVFYGKEYKIKPGFIVFNNIIRLRLLLLFEQVAIYIYENPQRPIDRND